MRCPTWKNTSDLVNEELPPAPPQFRFPVPLLRNIRDKILPSRTRSFWFLGLILVCRSFSTSTLVGSGCSGVVSRFVTVSASFCVTRWRRPKEEDLLSRGGTVLFLCPFRRRVHVFLPRDGSDKVQSLGPFGSDGPWPKGSRTVSRPVCRLRVSHKH